MDQLVPEEIPDSRRNAHGQLTTREAFLLDVEEGMKAAPMSVRLSPHIMSVANWASPFDDPIVRQFVPLKSKLLPDHPEVTMDSLHEEDDSPVPGLVHRYPDKVLFLGIALSEGGFLSISANDGFQQPRSVQYIVASALAPTPSALLPSLSRSPQSSPRCEGGTRCLSTSR